MYPAIPLEISQPLAEGVFCLVAALGTLVSFVLNWR
jgi:hypothetical protein